jgi:hypothetical protein
LVNLGMFGLLAAPFDARSLAVVVGVLPVTRFLQLLPFRKRLRIGIWLLYFHSGDVNHRLDPLANICLVRNTTNAYSGVQMQQRVLVTRCDRNYGISLLHVAEPELGTSTRNSSRRQIKCGY